MRLQIIFDNKKELTEITSPIKNNLEFSVNFWHLRLTRAHRFSGNEFIDVTFLEIFSVVGQTIGLLISRQ